MKQLIKKLINYEKAYNLIKTSFIYQTRKITNGNLANLLYNKPSKDLFIIWITWTNGKTTTANMLHEMLNKIIAPTITISTAYIKIKDKTIPNEKKMTSLDVFELQKYLSEAKTQWCKIAILEVSSHWLDQYRFEWIKFDYALLTNISRDHLDYHWNMNHYIQTKKKLFKYVLKNEKNNKFGSFPSDDKTGRKRYKEIPVDKKINYGLWTSATLSANEIEEKIDWTNFNLRYLGKNYPVSMNLVGAYNVSNFLAALSVWLQIWVDINEWIQVLSNFETVNGRMECIQRNDVKYFIDFAHTPDALDKALKFLAHQKNNNKLIVVFWATGNRDQWKRPEMAKIVWRYADIIIITDDDPDTENRLSIINQLTQEIQEVEIPKGQEIFIIPERRYAIKLAKEIAIKWDIVLLAWKWHETVQITNFWKRERNDKEEVIKD